MKLKYFYWVLVALCITTTFISCDNDTFVLTTFNQK